MRLKNIVALIMLVILCYSCQEDAVTETQFDGSIRRIRLSDAPDLINLLEGADKKFGFGRLSEQAIVQTQFGYIDTRRVIETHLVEGQPGPNYTFVVIPPDDVQGTIEYFILASRNDGYYGYVLQYIPANSDIKKVDLEEFTGKVRILDMNRTILSDDTFENGVELEQPNNVGGRTNTVYTECDCGYEYRIRDINQYTGTGSGFGEAEVEITGISCTCNTGGGDGSSGGDSDGPGTYIGGESGVPDGDGSIGGGFNNGGGDGDVISFDNISDEVLAELCKNYGECIYTDLDDPCQKL